MIQEIRPHKLYNQYQADKVCQPEDVLICIKDKAILAGGAEHQLQFPKRWMSRIIIWYLLERK